MSAHPRRPRRRRRRARRSGHVQLHVVPVDDLIAHEDTEACACGPRVELVDRDRWLIVHHSLDGREHHEPDHDAKACPGCRAPAGH